MRQYEVVVAGVKLKILKANHNPDMFRLPALIVVVAGVKLKILKANHNQVLTRVRLLLGCCCWCKVKNSESKSQLVSHS